MSATIQQKRKREDHDEQSDEYDTDDEILKRSSAKSLKTSKRTLRATSPSRFGTTLNTLLSSAGAEGIPLTVNARVQQLRHSEKKEQRNQTVKDVVKKEREENRRVRDVIGGWGGESERGLRKVAQKGVIKLFNAIHQAQQTSNEHSVKNTNAGKGKHHVTNRSSTKESPEKSRSQGNDSSWNQQQFMDIIRAGTISGS